ncbi:MAG TPA: pyridoxal phosphate-dependent aminotransferase [Bryobacteraceae bacterium]|nr:pyridoxal phosphate-dependent aminotransferase [Bryobacteraceae bacterium]
MYSYSERLPWPFLENAYSQAIALKRRANAPLLDLSLSNPTTALGSNYPNNAIRQAFGRLENFLYEPDPHGLSRAREAVAEYYRELGIAVDAENILLTASTSEAYALLFKLFCDPGDEVLAPVPSYPLFEYLSALESVKVVPYPLAYDGSWYLDIKEMASQIAPRTRAIVIVNPNNPTGVFLKRSECEELFALAARHNLPIVSDEVFMDYEIAAGPYVKTLIGRDDVLSFSLNGLSKAAGMPQMKLGWIVVNGPVAERAAAKARLELLLDTYLSVNTPVQRALPDLLLAGREVRDALLLRIGENLATISEVLSGANAHMLHLEGGWSAILRLPATRSEAAWLHHFLLEGNIVAQPGYYFDMPAEPYIVISLIVEPAVFRHGLSEIRRLLAS